MKFKGKKPIWGYFLIIPLLAIFIIGFIEPKRDIAMQIGYFIAIILITFAWYKFIITYKIENDKFIIKGGVVSYKEYQIHSVFYIETKLKKEYKHIRNALHKKGQAVIYMGDIFSRKVTIIGFKENNKMIVLGLTPSNPQYFVNIIQTTIPKSEDVYQIDLIS